MLTWLRRHFQRYRQRDPWGFCWRIALESTVAGLAGAVLVGLLGAADREIKMSFPVLMLLGVIVAPILETLIFQAFPIWLAKTFKATFPVQIAVSVIPFFLAHVIEGIGTGVAAGLITGFYLAFTYAHWREQRRWTAFWTTALAHAIHNALLISFAWTLAG